MPCHDAVELNTPIYLEVNAADYNAYSYCKVQVILSVVLVRNPLCAFTAICMQKCNITN